MDLLTILHVFDNEGRQYDSFQEVRDRVKDGFENRLLTIIRFMNGCEVGDIL